MDNPVLLKGKFGGLSIFSLFALFAGVVLLIFELLLLTAEEADQTLTGAARYAPGVVGLAFLWVFISAAFIRGSFSVYSDRIEGKKKFGSRFSVAFSEVEDVRMIGSQLVLTGKDKKPLLIQGAPNPRAVRGLIWMLLNYKDFISTEIWDQFRLPNKNESLFGEKNFRRLFHGENEDIEFVDGGFLFPLPGSETSAYLPSTDTVPHLTRDEDQNSFSSQLSSGAPILHFDPNPAKIPMRGLIAAIYNAKMEESQKKEMILTLVEKGNGLVADLGKDPEYGEFIDFGEWKISLLPA